MYRPSDKEVEVVAQILKDWGMPNRWTSAAVLSLVAAANVRAPKNMKKRTDDQMVNLLKDVVGIIIATREEQHCIWARNRENNLFPWESKPNGILETVGYLNERPICISLRVHQVNYKKILFIDATSSLVDWQMIDEWIELNLPNVKKTDATNWTNVIPQGE